MAPRITDPAEGHNVPPEVKQKHLRIIATLRREASEAQGRFRAARKAAEEAGLDLKQLALMEQLAKLEPEDAEKRVRGAFELARLAHLPLGTQLDFFTAGSAPVVAPSEDADNEHREWAAGEAGLEAGKNGRNRTDNPFPPGSALYDTWDRSWIAGQQLIADGMAPKKRGGGVVKVSAKKGSRKGGNPLAPNTAEEVRAQVAADDAEEAAQAASVH